MCPHITPIGTMEKGEGSQGADVVYRVLERKRGKGRGGGGGGISQQQRIIIKI